MLKYAAARVPSAALVLFLASIAIFGIIHLTPGSPAAILAGADATPQRIVAIERDLGLDRPLYVQYWQWISGLATGDLGTSYIVKAPIGTLITQRLGATLELTAAAMVLMTIMALGLGIWGASSQGRIGRQAVYVTNTLALSTPPFVSGVLLVLVLSIQFPLLPPGGHVSVLEDPVLGLKALIMPAIALALPHGAAVARILQPAIRQARREEYAQMAVAKGLAPRLITFRHILPNALPPAIVMLGIRFGQLLGGAVIVEAIFARPGLGQLVAKSVLTKDYVVVQDLLMAAVAIAIAMQILTDLAHAALDPRIGLDR